MSAASPPEYRYVTGQPPIASQPVAPRGSVSAAGPGGIAMVPYPTVGGPIYVQQFESVPRYTQLRFIHTVPPAFMPNDYPPVTLMVVIICSILNLTSMVISLSALLCSIMSISKKQDRFYLSARNYGDAAIVLDIVCVTYTLMFAFITVFSFFGVIYI